MLLSVSAECYHVGNAQPTERAAGRCRLRVLAALLLDHSAAGHLLLAPCTHMQGHISLLLVLA